MVMTTAQPKVKSVNTEKLSSVIVPPTQAPNYRKIVINFCTPGTEYSNKFLTCWTALLYWAKNTNLEFNLINATGSNISHVREALLMGDINGTSDQKPFQGKPYDYILFCDSDQLFTPQDIDLLLKADKEVIAGCIKMMDGNYAQGWYCEEYFAKFKATYRLTDFMLESFDEPFRVTLLGCGFTLVKYGIIEQLKFPWFKSIDYPLPMVGYLGEDMSLFLRIQRLGYKCWLHPKVRIPHEKTYEI